jgi:hypothetical protein
MLPLGGVSTGNKVVVFHSGDPAFQAMWDAIDKVENCIYLF